jgi:hypothetical protein
MNGGNRPLAMSGRKKPLILSTSKGHAERVEEWCHPSASPEHFWTFPQARLEEDPLELYQTLTLTPTEPDTYNEVYSTPRRADNHDIAI